MQLKMDKINLFWYKMENGQKNFGDELGPFLVSQLSGSPVNYIPIVNSPIKILLLYFYGLTKGTHKVSQFKPVIKSLGKKDILISVGSIISWYNNPSAHVWGAGIMNRYDKINNAKFYAVRGKYTQLRLQEHGYKVPEAIGDPALLLPLVVKPKSSKKYKLGVIPHYIHYEEVVNLFYNQDDVLVINLRDDIEKVVNNIFSCEKTISSSLHGIIVSHAYGIECLWYNFSKKKIAGDNIKFKDYFSSVEIEEYSPFEIFSAGSRIKIDEIIKNITEHTSINKSNKDLNHLQYVLLKEAPFKIKKEYIERSAQIKS